MLLNAFSVPLYEVDLSYNTKILEEWLDVHSDLTKKNKFQFKDGWTTHKLSTPDFQQNLINEYELTEFKAELTKHLEIYLHAIDFNRPCYWNIQECWMTSFSESEYAHIHNHAPSDISGCYYVKSNGQDGNFFFLNPSRIMSSTLLYRNIPDRLFVRPKPGKLMLFPGWIDHGVEVNRTKDERCSVSFNIDFQRA